jgi:hypothetical protein
LEKDFQQESGIKDEQVHLHFFRNSKFKIGCGGGKCTASLGFVYRIVGQLEKDNNESTATASLQKNKIIM